MTFCTYLILIHGAFINHYLGYHFKNFILIHSCVFNFGLYLIQILGFHTIPVNLVMKNPDSDIWLVIR